LTNRPDFEREDEKTNMAKLTIVRWLRLSLVLSLSCLLLLAGCSFNPVSSGANKTLTVATEATYPPFEFQTAQGELVGFDIDLIKAIAAASGFQVKFQQMPFAGMIPALQAQTVDAAVAAMTITAERAKTISFSRPYFRSGLAIATRTTNQDITNLDSLKNKKIAVQIGTTGAKQASGIPGAEIRSFDDAPTALQELINGNVDAALHDQPVILYAIKTGNVRGIKVVSNLLTEEYFGIPTPKGSPNLALINQGLSTVLKNNTYAQLYQKWFNAQPPELPEKSSVENQTTSGVFQLFTSLSIVLKSLPLLLSGALVTLQLTAFSLY
jgi:arginine/lysine/histidine/glutamine transport system substrate-binding/permease protein